MISDAAAPQHGAGLFSNLNNALADDFNQIDVSGLKIPTNRTSLSSMFQNDGQLSAIDLSGLDLSNVNNVSRMFEGVTLSDINLNGLNPGEVSDMSGMFSHDPRLRSVNLVGFGNVNNVYKLFSGDNMLERIKLDDNLRLGNNWGVFQNAQLVDNYGNLAATSKLEANDFSSLRSVGNGQYEIYKANGVYPVFFALHSGDTASDNYDIDNLKPSSQWVAGVSDSGGAQSLDGSVAPDGSINDEFSGYSPQITSYPNYHNHLPQDLTNHNGKIISKQDGNSEQVPVILKDHGSEIGQPLMITTDGYHPNLPLVTGDYIEVTNDMLPAGYRAVNFSSLPAWYLVSNGNGPAQIPANSADPEMTNPVVVNVVNNGEKETVPVDFLDDTHDDTKISSDNVNINSSGQQLKLVIP